MGSSRRLAGGLEETTAPNRRMTSLWSHFCGAVANLTPLPHDILIAQEQPPFARILDRFEAGKSPFGRNRHTDKVPSWSTSHPTNSILRRCKVEAQTFTLAQLALKGTQKCSGPCSPFRYGSRPDWTGSEMTTPEDSARSVAPGFSGVLGPRAADPVPLEPFRSL